MSFFKNIFSEGTNDASNSKVNWIALSNAAQLTELEQESKEKPLLIFKHSTRCGISRMSLRQFENEFDLDEEITPYFVDLLAHRDVSNEIASKFGVPHQSPQLLLIKDGAAIYHASHDSIDAGKLKGLIE